MVMDEKARLDAFEKMLHAIRENYQNTDQKMKRLKEEGKEKTATYRQLMGNKMQYQNMLSLYQIYGLTRRGRMSMKKVMVIGCPGAGKSTFARKLQN